ncbi:MAG: hypothetical protein M1834_008845 [Cirrosporium novae-zelandiae]|nr:MAG: hypothetical protein M1834_008845 [Cirrosporium novae-zelandiae]
MENFVVQATSPLSGLYPTMAGCEHLHKLFSETPQVKEEMIARRKEIQKEVLKSSLSMHGYPQAGLISLRPYLFCLQCPSTFTLVEKYKHIKEKAHFFSVDSRSGTVFCNSCNDFVYDPHLDAVVADPVTRKRKRDSEELTMIDGNAIKKSCGIPALKGIYNLGLSCYMGAVLQALIHVPLVSNFFLQDRHHAKDCEREACLSCSFDEIITDCWDTSKTDSLSTPTPKLLLNIWKHSKDMSGYGQQDCHEFFGLFLDQLHKTNCAPEDIGIDDSKCRCFFHRAFYGKLRSTITCKTCHNPSRIDDPIVDLNLAMNASSKKAAGKPASPSKPLDLTSLLRAYITPEENDEPYECSHCAPTIGKQPATKRLKFRRVPSILCITLKRFDMILEHSHKLETPVSFPLVLNMQPYLTPRHNFKKERKEKPRPRCIFDLMSVVVHKSENGKTDAGHYVAYCRQATDWFYFDDHKVVQVSEAEVLSKDAYLLLYMRRSVGTAMIEE